jgi:hypothetical protein
MSFDVAVSCAEYVPNDIAREFIDKVKRAGLKVEVEKRGREIYAGYEWLVPAAIVVFIVQKYFGPMLQEAGKDHYAAIKGGLGRLLSRTIGPDREIKTQFVASSPGKVSKTEAPNLSVSITMRDGRPIKFVFENVSDPESVEKCLETMWSLLERHHTKSSNDCLEQKVAEVARRPGQEAVMRFNAENSEWELVYPTRR